MKPFFAIVGLTLKNALRSHIFQLLLLVLLWWSTTHTCCLSALIEDSHRTQFLFQQCLGSVWL